MSRFMAYTRIPLLDFVCHGSGIGHYEVGFGQAEGSRFFCEITGWEMNVSEWRKIETGVARKAALTAGMNFGRLSIWIQS